MSLQGMTKISWIIDLYRLVQNSVHAEYTSVICRIFLRRTHTSPQGLLSGICDEKAVHLC